MSVAQLAQVNPVVSPDELVAALVPSPRFSDVRFTTYRPDADEPSQAAAVAYLTDFAARITDPPRSGGWFRRSSGRQSAGSVYLDGGFGVGKTHLLASLWHAVPGPKAFGSFGEYTQLVGALGFANTVTRLSGHTLVAVDEFELDDPGDTMLMTRLLGELSDAGVSLAATSNTLPDKLGEGRFAAEDFRREIQALSGRFHTLRIDGPDFRHSGLIAAPEPWADERVQAAAERTPGATLDTFGVLCQKLASLHPSRYGRLLDGVTAVHLQHITPAPDQAVALRLVTFIDRLYDLSIPVRASGGSLGELFTPEMINGGYRKKYLRATSRILALARDGERTAG